MIDAMMKNTVAPLVLRLCLAAVFIYHGTEKVSKSWGTAWGGDQLPVIQQVLVGWGELLGGIAMLIGFLTRLAAVGLAVIMVGAIAFVHGKNGFSGSPEAPGYEYNVVLLGDCIVLLLTGGGTLAADRWVRLRPKRH